MVHPSHRVRFFDGKVRSRLASLCRSALLVAGSAGLCFSLIASNAIAYDRQVMANDAHVLPNGDGQFQVTGVPRGPVTIYTYRPASAHSDSPIWIVMSGQRRQAHRHLAFDYYDTWRPLAERAGAILLVPEFTAEKWPGVTAYNYGNVRAQTGDAKPWNQTAFHVVEEAFQKARHLLGGSQRKFSIFGHGAGSQFVQRYVLHSGCRLIDRAVSANPGWYMVADSQYEYPYGLGGAAIPASTLRGAFACNYVLLLGTADVNTSGLRNEPDAIAQGKTRYERGHFYFNRARGTASAMGARFNWQLGEVPGVSHEADRMAPAGAAAMAGQPVTRARN